MILGDGVDFNALWSSVKKAGTELITKDLPNAVEKTVVNKAATVATPVVQQVAMQKTKAAVSAGNVALFTAGGVLLGALIAGGSWQRRSIGGVVIGGLGAFAGFRIGLLKQDTV